jgi:hypothetical protein
MTSRTDIGNLTMDDILIRPGPGAKRLPGYERLSGIAGFRPYSTRVTTASFLMPWLR